MSVVVVAASDAAVIAASARTSDSAMGALPPADLAHLHEPIVETVDAAALKAALADQIEEMGGEDDLVPDTSDLPPHELRGVLEAVLLVSNKPQSEERLAKLLPGTDPGYLSGFLAGLASRYTAEGRGWDLRRIGNGWQMLTRAEFHPWVRQLDRRELPSTLTKSAMETLAIIAYKQPISRGQIEDIRGVQSGPMVRQLVDLKLVQMVGRSEELLGKPVLYGTTDVFLDRFGIASPEDLPRRHELGI